MRHAFFILENDYEAFSLAVKLSGTQWGGIRSLIVPVHETEGLRGEPNIHLLKLHEPDRFVDFTFKWRTGNYTLRDRLDQQLREIFQYRIDLALWRDPVTDDHSLHAYSHFYGAKLAERTPFQVRVLLNVFQWDESSSLHPILLAIFGQIYPGQEQGYGDVFTLQHIDILSQMNRFWEYQYERTESSSVLNLTSHLLNWRKIVGGCECTTFHVLFIDVL